MRAEQTTLAWEPFETAPKDGRKILVWREDTGPFVASYRTYDSRTTRYLPSGWTQDSDRFWFDQSGEDLSIRLPTLWAPIPDDPVHVHKLAITHRGRIGESKTEFCLVECVNCSEIKQFMSAEEVDAYVIRMNAIFVTEAKE